MGGATVRRATWGVINWHSKIPLESNLETCLKGYKTSFIPSDPVISLLWIYPKEIIQKRNTITTIKLLITTLTIPVQTRNNLNALQSNAKLWNFKLKRVI